MDMETDARYLVCGCLGAVMLGLLLGVIMAMSEGCMSITNTQYVYVTSSNSTSVGAPEQAKPVSIPTNATVPAGAFGG